ncbi:hypothetical protein RIF29_18515 [Crotalaria pallida]|uniref:Uncharacterized protein n=1 Tax=Crotalaria pallida TaxID=3830 RepID=A0AAN9FJ65_CROPI
MFNFARLMVSRGHHVTIITTPSNAQLFDKTTIEDDTCFHVHIIRFPSNQVDLPVGVENLLDSYDDQTVGKILMATNLIEPEIEALMKKRAPDIFIPDMIFTWSETLAKSLGIPTLIFNPISIFVFCMIETVKSSSLLPLPYNINPDPSFIKFSESMMENVKKSHGVIVNSFPELEVEYTQHYEKLINNGCKVWQIGPISLMIQKTITKVDEEKNDEYYLSWLNSKEQESVVYICFGSMCLISDEQFFEIARGIEASGHQFLWVVQNKLDKTPLPLPEEGGSSHNALTTLIDHLSTLLPNPIATATAS